MTRLLPVLLSFILSSCVTTFEGGRLRSIPYSGHGPIFRYQVSPRMIDAAPEVAPIISTLLKHAKASLDTLTAPEQPDLVPLIYRGQERYQLVEPWNFTYNGIEQAVPLGIIVDGASVPPAFWPFMPRDGVHRAAALAHDLSYQRSGILDGITITRKQADAMLYNMMVAAGVGTARAGIVYDAVRLCGASSWGAHPPIIEPVEHRMFAARIVKPRGLFSHLYAP